MMMLDGYCARGYACSRKLNSPCKGRKDRYNQVQYKGENQQCVDWPILGSYNHWNIINCINSRKYHRKTNTKTNVHIKPNAIRNIDLNIGKDTSNK